MLATGGTCVVRIVLDPDEVNQDRVVTLTDGVVVELADADLSLLEDVARQLHIYRGAYAHAFKDPDVGAAVRGGEEPVEAHSPLYLRVDELTRERRRSRKGDRDKRELDPRVLLQDETWPSSTGIDRKLEALTPSHRANLVQYLERISDRLRQRFEDEGLELDVLEVHDPWVAGTPLYRRLQQLITAETARERAMDEAREVARRIHFERTGEWPER